MLSLPPVGRAAEHLRRADRRPRPAPGRYASPCSTSPVALIQLSRNTACICATTGPSARKWVSRQCSGSCASPVPQVGDADAAGEADLAVDDEQLAMCAVVETAQVVPVRLVVTPHFDAGLLELVEICLFHLVAADPVQQHMDLDPGARRSASASANALPIASGPVDVRLERDGALRRADSVQHRRKNLSPLSSASKRLPFTMAGPSSTPMARENCGSSAEYRRGMCCSIFFSPPVKFITSTVASSVRPTAATMAPIRLLRLPAFEKMRLRLDIDVQRR